jgi:hypothetical protein
MCVQMKAVGFAGDHVLLRMTREGLPTTVLQNVRIVVNTNIECPSASGDRLCGLVVRVLGYRSGGPG